MGEAPREEMEGWRLLVFRNRGAELLLERAGNSWRLPEISLPRSERIPPHIARRLAELANLSAVSLFELAPARARGVNYYAAEVVGHQAPSGSGFDWIPRLAASAVLFSEASDYQALEETLKRTNTSGCPERGAPFARFGWFSELREWVQQVTGRVLSSSRDGFLQLNASESFSLVRFQAGAGAVWFKAVGPPNAHEFPITIALSSLFPAYLPELLAHREDWNGWLTCEASGRSLALAQNASEWQRPAASLASLQIASWSQLDAILSCGAKDLRLAVLQRQAEPFFELVEALMELQQKKTPSPLSRAVLGELRSSLEEALERLLGADIPDTLGHLDMNPGNLVCSADSCVFLDWAEAMVGNPFLTFEYLLEYFRQAFPNNPSAEAGLTANYLSAWDQLLDPVKLRQVMGLAPALAAYAHAVTLAAERRHKLPADPELGASLRSLTRRIHREVCEWRSPRV